jgi:hypothetical protein
MLGELLLSAILIIAVITLYIVVTTTLNDNEKYLARIRELSHMLQIAEYQTGTPYYTTAGEAIQGMEGPQWLYKSIREKLIYNNNVEPAAE